MAAKIQLNFGKIGTFGGIFSTIDAFRKAGLSNLIDNTLGNKGINTKYTYSHIVENLMSTYLCGGECIEDCNLLRTERYQRNPDYLFASADTILRTFQSLSVANRTVNAESGKTYQFNVNDRLNGLLLDSLLLCGLVGEDTPVVFDYDNQFVAANSRLFYIRANQCASLAARLEEIPEDDWTECEINFRQLCLPLYPHQRHRQRRTGGR